MTSGAAESGEVSRFTQLFCCFFTLSCPTAAPPASFSLSLIFSWHDTKHREMDPTDRFPQPPSAPGTSQLTPGSPFSAPPWSHRAPKVCLYHTPASCSNLLQFSAVPSQTRRQRGDNPPHALSPPKHPTSMTEAVQMPLESGWTQLPSSSVERTKAAFPMSHPKGLLPPPSAC